MMMMKVRMMRKEGAEDAANAVDLWLDIHFQDILSIVDHKSLDTPFQDIRSMIIIFIIIIAACQKYHHQLLNDIHNTPPHPIHKLQCVLSSRCQLEGVDEEGLKEREDEKEERKIRRKKREDMHRCKNPNNSARGNAF